MDARNATSPGKAEATDPQPIPIVVPLTLLGAFDLTAVIAIASLALRQDQRRPPAKTRRQKST
jgi:hypothetical protein